MKYILSWIPAVIIMAVIFYFSSKPAESSGESSKSIANRLLNTYEKISDKRLDEEIRDERLESIDFIIRKAAHVTEYALLSAAIAFPLSVRKFRGIRLLFLTMLTAVLYAASDEFHQIFVPGRSGELRDVAIDGIGALIGVVLFLIASKPKAGAQLAREEAEEYED
jgi:VanZ family protein